MASKNTKQAKRDAAISAMFRGQTVSEVAERCEAILAIPNKLRLPETASATTLKCTVKTARATSARAKKPFVINKH